MKFITKKRKVKKVIQNSKILKDFIISNTENAFARKRAGNYLSEELVENNFTNKLVAIETSVQLISPDRRIINLQTQIEMTLNPLIQTQVTINSDPAREVTELTDTVIE